MSSLCSTRSAIAATSRSIVAIPELHDRVIAAQSARVDGVSGATYTTEGYLDSLQSALDAAGFSS